METFQEVAESQKKEESKGGSAAADLLEKLSVEGKTDAVKKDEKSEDKTGEQESTSERESKAEADAENKVEEPTSSA